MLRYYKVKVKDWRAPYVFASTVPWPNGTFVLVQVQNQAGMIGENQLVKGEIWSTISENEANSILCGRGLKEIVCAISEEEYQNDSIQLSNREIIARQKEKESWVEDLGAGQV